eukprot:5086094-Amphidinium_carterae.2
MSRQYTLTKPAKGEPTRSVQTTNGQSQSGFETSLRRRYNGNNWRKQAPQLLFDLLDLHQH